MKWYSLVTIAILAVLANGDVAGFPEGNYILCAYTTNGTLTGRFVVRH